MNEQTSTAYPQITHFCTKHTSLQVKIKTLRVHESRATRRPFDDCRRTKPKCDLTNFHSNWHDNHRHVSVPHNLCSFFSSSHATRWPVLPFLTILCIYCLCLRLCLSICHYSTFDPPWPIGRTASEASGREWVHHVRCAVASCRAIVGVSPVAL